MHSLQRFNISTALVALLITLSVLTVVGIGEGFRLLILERGSIDGENGLKKRDSGSKNKFTFPWEQVVLKSTRCGY
jgi:hypothetical protein